MENESYGGKPGQTHSLARVTYHAAGPLAGTHLGKAEHVPGYVHNTHQDGLNLRTD